MHHQPWRWQPTEGGLVSEQALAARPVDPVLYSMRDVWGFGIDELPIEPFDIQVRIKAPSILEGLKMFERAVADYMSEHFDAYNRDLFLERLHWHDATAAQPHCEIFMAD
ncbi:MAG: hypothetical protein GWP50_04455 [Proteobacteria bacterium]|nr:hypothetical protein [Pseudomonadota bacterium]